MVWFIVALVWVFVAIATYYIIDDSFEEGDAKEWEKVWYAAVWPCTLILYVIHWLHNKS